VAVDRTPARSAAAALARKTVANMAPAGAQWASLPQTATAAPLYRRLGALVLLLALAGVALLGRQRSHSRLV
jgi:hypothetical protein